MENKEGTGCVRVRIFPLALFKKHKIDNPEKGVEITQDTCSHAKGTEAFTRGGNWLKVEL